MTAPAYLNRYIKANEAAPTRHAKEDPFDPKYLENEAREIQGLGDDGDYFTDDFPNRETSPRPQGMTKQEAQEWLKELFAEARKDKDINKIKELDGLSKAISRTPGNLVPTELAASLLLLTGENPEEGSDDDLDLGMGPDSSSGVLTVSSLRKELSQLKSKIEANAGFSPEEKGEYQERIEKLLLKLDLNPSEDGLGMIQEEIEAIKMGGDGIVGGGDEDDYQTGEAPSRTENGVAYFESKKGKDLELIPSAKTAAENIVSTSGEVQISPPDSITPVEVTESEGYIVVTVKAEKKDIVYKIKDTASKIQINSKKVTGDYENEERLVTVGKKGLRFISPEKNSEIVEKLRKAAGSTIAGGKYSSDAENENRDIRKVLEKMADAASTDNPKEKKELWDEAEEEVSRWLSSGDLGNANDRAATLCWAIHGTFKKSGFKQMLQDGTIPRDFANKVAEVLVCRSDEMYGEGGGDGYQGWNHKTYADFLEKHSAPSELSSDEDE